MAGLLWSMGVLGALRLTAQTPDALCPTLADVQNAVNARVGEITGGEYEARFGIVRGTREQTDVIRLLLIDDAGQTLLSRDLPVETGDCASTAQALALILERYFEELGAPALAPAAAAPTDSKQVDHIDAPAPVVQSSTARSPVPVALREEETAPSPLALRLAAGGGVLGDQGTGFIGLGAEVWLGRSWTIAADAQWTTVERTDTSGAILISAQSYWAFAAIQWWAHFRHVALGVGPSGGAQIEVARSSGAEFESSSATRAVPALGAIAAFRYDFSAHWSLEANVRGVGLVGGATKRFVIGEVDGRETDVLEPASGLLLCAGGLQFRF